jgi:hypothetical protein
MIRPLLLLTFLSIITISSSTSVRLTNASSQDSCAQAHEDWVTNALEKMESIKPGMTREDLVRVFTTEGGLSTGLHRTFVSRDCPYFKVDVEFKAVGRPNRDNEGRVTRDEDSRDIIVKLSRPYLQFSVVD